MAAVKKSWIFNKNVIRKFFTAKSPHYIAREEPAQESKFGMSFAVIYSRKSKKNTNSLKIIQILS